MSAAARPRTRSRRAAPRLLRASVRAIAPDAHDVGTALVAAAAILTLIVVTASVTAVAFARSARDALDFPFHGIAPRLGEAAEIFAHNARLMGAIAAAAIIVQTLWLAAAPPDQRPATSVLLDRPPATGTQLGPIGQVVRLGLDLTLALAVLGNTVIVGMALGAYEGRMARAMLPHGPVELAAFALALALYLRARRGPLALAPGALLAAWAIVLLALAALLETFLGL